MIVTNDGGSVDILEYVSKQFPKDVKTMLEIRDELAKRQGAMSAVKDAEKDRLAAADELARATVIAAEADAKKKTAAEYETKVKAAEAALAAKSAEFANKTASVEKVLSDRQANLESREKFVSDREASLKEDAAQLDAARAALEARIKAFQDKVAALNV